MAAGLKPDAIHGGVNLGNAQNLVYLISDADFFGNVYGFATKAAGLSQTFRDEVANNDAGCPE